MPHCLPAPAGGDPVRRRIPRASADADAPRNCRACARGRARTATRRRCAGETEAAGGSREGCRRSGFPTASGRQTQEVAVSAAQLMSAQPTAALAAAADVTEGVLLRRVGHARGLLMLTRRQRFPAPPAGALF
jgi:hypothetical protein